MQPPAARWVMPVQSKSRVIAWVVDVDYPATLASVQMSIQTVNSWLLIREEGALQPDLDGLYRKSI